MLSTEKFKTYFPRSNLSDEELEELKKSLYLKIGAMIDEQIDLLENEKKN